jgi:hypothetical protein
MKAREIIVSLRLTRAGLRARVDIATPSGAASAALPEEAAWRLQSAIDEEISRLAKDAQRAAGMVPRGTIKQVEVEMVRQALMRYDTLEEAAGVLGVTKKTLYSKRKDYGLMAAALLLALAFAAPARAQSPDSLAEPPHADSAEITWMVNQIDFIYDSLKTEIVYRAGRIVLLRDSLWAVWDTVRKRDALIKRHEETIWQQAERIVVLQDSITALHADTARSAPALAELRAQLVAMTARAASAEERLDAYAADVRRFNAFLAALREMLGGMN